MLLIFLAVFDATVNSLTRTWLPNSNVLNKLNWDPASGDCQGLLFPENLNVPMGLDSLTTKEIIFPMNGKIVLFNHVKISFNNKENGCIRIKRIASRTWYDPKNWNQLPNKAIPDIERIPCECDDVVFPENSTFALESHSSVTKVNSLKLAGELLDQTAWNSRQYSRLQSESIFDSLAVKTLKCNENANQCHSYIFLNAIKFYICGTLQKLDSNNCKDPINVEGNCAKICGASVMFKANQNINFKKYKKYLEDSSDAIEFYISEVINEEQPFLQLVLVDKEESTGGYQAGIVAKKLEKAFVKDGVTYYTIRISGDPIRTNEVVSITFGIIFGTLLVNVIIFTFIYAKFIGPLKGFEIRSSQKFRPFVFARFENKNEGELSFERSLASSVASLEKSFDNPMYGMPSTSTQYISVGEDVLKSGENDTEMKDYEGISKHVEIEDLTRDESH